MEGKIIIHILQFETLYTDYEQNINGPLFPCLLCERLSARHTCQQKCLRRFLLVLCATYGSICLMHIFRVDVQENKRRREKRLHLLELQSTQFLVGKAKKFLAASKENVNRHS